MNTSKKLTVVITGLIIIASAIFALKGSFIKPQAPATSPADAQFPGAPSMGEPPGSSGQFAEFQKLHKYGLQLMKLINNIKLLEEDGRAALTPAQAKSILAVLQPLRKQKSLDESAARKAVVAVQAVLTDNQHSVISEMPSQPKFRQAGPPPGARPMGAPSGPPPGAGAKPMEGFNPLNPPSGGPSDQQGGANKLFDELAKKSAGS